MTRNKKRIRKLSTAVFRGSRTEYRFDVYPITTSITDNPAVFVFSRRLSDKKGRWHHAVSCAGETQSIVTEIKRHKRAKCIKSNQANVVCILKEADGATRSGILDDIADARAFSCVRGRFEAAKQPKPATKAGARSAKILKFGHLNKNRKPQSIGIEGNTKRSKKAARTEKVSASHNANRSETLVVVKPAKLKKPKKRVSKLAATRAARSKRAA